MRKDHITITITALALVVLMLSSCQVCVRAQSEKAPYPAMAPLAQYLIADEKAEIALARSAAPASVSNGAEVMVLRHDGYTTVVKGSNGFVCIVEEPQHTRASLLQCGRCEQFSTLLSDEKQTGTGREIAGGDRRGNGIGTGQEGTSAACAWNDRLHDVEAPVSKRSRKELASTCNVLCFG
jgi:hypothetical protein